MITIELIIKFSPLMKYSNIKSNVMQIYLQIRMYLAVVRLIKREIRFQDLINSLKSFPPKYNIIKNIYKQLIQIAKMKGKPSISSLSFFLSSTGYLLTNPKVLQQPQIYKETIFQILIHLVKHCLDVPQLKLDIINPQLTHLIDIQNHSSSIQFANELMLIEHMLSRLKIDFRLMTDYFRIDKKNTQRLIIGLMEYDTFKVKLLEKVSSKLQQKRRLQSQYLKHIKKAELSQCEYYRLLAKKQYQAPQYNQLMHRNNIKKQKTDKCKQKRSNLIIKRNQLQIELQLIKRSNESKNLQLFNLQNQISASRKLIALNIQQTMHKKSSVQAQYNDILSRGKELMKQRDNRMEMGQQKLEEYLNTYTRTIQQHLQNTQILKITTELQDEIDSKTKILDNYLNNKNTAQHQQTIAIQTCAKLQNQYNKYLAVADSNKRKLEQSIEAQKLLLSTQNTLDKVLADVQEINHIHLEKHSSLVQQIHENYHLFKNRMLELQVKSNTYFDVKAKRAMKIYQTKEKQ